MNLLKKTDKKKDAKSNLQLERNKRKTREFLEKWGKQDAKKT